MHSFPPSMPYMHASVLYSVPLRILEEHHDQWPGCMLLMLGGGWRWWAEESAEYSQGISEHTGRSEAVHCTGLAHPFMFVTQVQ